MGVYGEAISRAMKDYSFFRKGGQIIGLTGRVVKGSAAMKKKMAKLRAMKKRRV